MEIMDTTQAFDRIRERAYAIWESEGRPEGCAERHWSAAEQEIGYANGAADRDMTQATRPNASDAELQANAYGQQDTQPSTVQKRRRA
jgi:hypothetical protein